jgi:hypothetical protein
MEPESPLSSTLATYAGIILMCIPISACAFDPSIPIPVAVIVGAVIGTPLVILGIRLDRNTSSVGRSSQGFWPTQPEIWGILGLFVFGIYFLILVIIVNAAVLLLPPDDDWGSVAVRLVSIVLAAVGWYFWKRLGINGILPLFRGKIADETLDALAYGQSKKEPDTVAGVMWKNWLLPVTSLVASCVAVGIIDLNDPWFNIDSESRSDRGIEQMIQWCRGNPNTVFALSILVAIGALGIYLYQIHKAARSTQNGTVSSD